MSVPLLDLKGQYATIKDEVDAAVAAVFESQWFVMGETVEAFEKRMAEYFGVPHAIGVSSGSDALLLACMAAGVDGGTNWPGVDSIHGID